MSPAPRTQVRASHVVEADGRSQGGVTLGDVARLVDLARAEGIPDTVKLTATVRSLSGSGHGGLVLLRVEARADENQGD